MKSMLKDAAILFAITLFAGAVLGFVYDLTKGPIAKQEQTAKVEASQEVFPDAVSFEALSVTEEEMTLAVTEKTVPESMGNKGLFGNVSINEAQRALDGDNNELGYVLTITTHEGYGGDIQFSMGIRNDGTLNGISILRISETAGLGARAEEVLKPQFANKQVSQFVYTKSGAASEEEIDAISSATITTEALTNAVNAGLYYFQTELEGGEGYE